MELTRDSHNTGSGFFTLLKKEVMRFWAVLGQTVTAPVITALLYLLVFAQAMQGRAAVYDGVSYTEFLVPGLVMMTIIQNAFANTSSSLIQSKVMGNLVFLLMAPLGRVRMVCRLRSARPWCARHRGGRHAGGDAAVRALAAACAIGALLAMFLLAGGSLAVFGLIAGIVAQKFDHLAAFTNFFITPLSFLSGVFYSVHSLPEFWFEASHLNPFFYMIDGFRYGFFGVADAPIGISLLWCRRFLRGGIQRLPVDAGDRLPDAELTCTRWVDFFTL